MSITTATTGLPSPTRRGDVLAGLGTILRFMLHRDRIRFPAWTLGLSLLLAYFASVLQIVFPTPEDLEAFAVFGSNPAAALLMGPGFSEAEITLARFLAATYGIYLIIGAALMNILTVTRHTRVEEQSGRAELVRANVVGRYTQLTSALLVAVLMNLVLAVLMGGLLTAMDFEPTGSFALGASIGGAGLAFAGITATCVQLTEFSRTASGIAGGILGGGFLVRGLGDISASQDGDLAWLSWLSPIGWSQRVAPFGDDDWRPLALSAACLAIFTALAYALAARRDLAAGLVPARRGSAHAGPWLSSPLALALRLQRASLIGWSLALFASGLAYGSFTQSMLEGFTDAPPEVLAIFGGEENMLAGYLGMMGLLMAMIVGAYAILAMQALRSEETDGRTEPVLATAVGRPGWLGSWLTVTGLGVILFLGAAGLGDAIGAVVSTGSTELFGDVLLGHLVHVPAVWVVLALAALLYAVTPRLVPLVWILFGYSFFFGFFGAMLDIPAWVLEFSPFEHIGRYPAEDVSIGGMIVLTAIAAVIATGALALFRRRDLTTA